MEKFTTESLETMINGIKKLLLEDRCSFSKDEINILTECVQVLKVIRNNEGDFISEGDLMKIAFVLAHLLKICCIAESLKNLVN